jgi:hypothetical protein
MYVMPRTDILPPHLEDLNPTEAYYRACHSDGASRATTPISSMHPSVHDTVK